MKTLIAAVLILLLLPRPAAAERLDWKPYAVLAAGQTLDGMTTIRFLHNGSGCREGNRRYWPGGIYTAPTSGQIARDKAVAIGLSTALNVSTEALARWLTRRGDGRAGRIVAWLGKGENYFGGGVGAYDGVRNLALCGW